MENDPQGCVCHIIPSAMSQGLKIQAPSSPERDITGLLPSGCLCLISPLCRNKALKSVGGHIFDVCYMEASGADLYCRTMSVKVLVWGNWGDSIYAEVDKLLNVLFS